MKPNAIAIIQGGRLAQRSNDTEYRFRQDSDFWYLTGFDHPDATAVIRNTENGPSFSLFVQPRDRAAEIWTGYRPGIEGAVEEYGADEAYESSQLLEALDEILEATDHLYHVFGRNSELDRKLLDVQETLRVQSRRGVEPAREILDPRSILHEMRLFKTPDEIEIMRQAADITREAHQEAATRLKAGRFEYEIEARLDYVFRRRGGWGPAYSSIVAGGANATVLHYVRNDQPLREDSLVLIDAGAELLGYASDVTRTYPVSKKYTGPSKEVYDVVLNAQKRAIQDARPGMTLADLHENTIQDLVNGMLEIGLMKGRADSIIESEAFRKYYMHGTSHWLGLDVHDSGRYTQGDGPRLLEAGMAFTIEPGLYIPINDEEAPEKFRGIGIRIEDNVVITEDASENLTAAIPKETADVEQWIQS